MRPMLSKGCLRRWSRACAWVFIGVYCMLFFIASVSDIVEKSNYAEEQKVFANDSVTTPMDEMQERAFKLEEKTIVARRDQVLHVCNNSWKSPLTWNLAEDEFFENLIVDSRNELVYCSVLKAGSTFWKRLIGVTSGKRSEKNPFDIAAITDHRKYLETMNDVEPIKIDLKLLHSLKFMFSRDPYSRLFSCYIDKVFTPRPFYRSLREDIVLISRPARYDLVFSFNCSLDVTFAEFVHFVVFSLRSNVRVDSHFLPMYQSCRPCEIAYDFLGKMETFGRDSNHLFRRAGLTKIENISKEHSDIDAIADMVESVFSERNESQECVPFGKRLQAVWKKAIIRGILSKDETIPVEFLKNISISQIHYHTAMLQAYSRSQQDPTRLGNRKLAMREAFKTVAKDDLNDYRKLFWPDFAMFGYDVYPQDIFPIKTIYDQDYIFL